MKTISMDYATYKEELSDEYYRGFQSAIESLFDYSLAPDSDIIPGCIIRYLEEDENFTLADRLRLKKLNYQVGGK